VQEIAGKVSNAIQTVRMKLSGKTVREISDTLGLGFMSVAGYLAWNIGCGQKAAGINEGKVKLLLGCSFGSLGHLFRRVHELKA
jgi:hypothetical protein